MPNVFRVCLPRVVLGGLLLTAVAAPAQAQLGRLKKMAADAVKDAAKDKLAGQKDSATTATTGKATGGATGSAATPVDLTLSDDRIALVLASLQPMVADAQKRQELARVRKSHAASSAASKACMDSLAKSFNPMTMGSMSDATSAQITRINDQASGAADRLNVAIKRNDKRAWLFLQDTVMVLQQRSAVLTMRGKCTVDFTPPPIIEAQVAQQMRQAESEDTDRDGFAPPAVVK
jgi:hypothetical protein